MRTKILTALAGSALLAGCSNVDTGSVGLYKKYGAVEGDALAPGGPYLYNPMTTDIVTMNTQTLKWTGRTATYTQDIQQAAVTFTITYQLDQSYAAEMYRRFGRQWAARIMPQVVLQSIKDEFGRWDAVRAIENRSKLQQNVFRRIEPRLAKVHIMVQAIDIINIDYNEAFENAVEAKQIAVQKANEARNHTVEVQEEANQVRIRAEAEANSMRVRSQALEANPKLVDWEAVQKWDGKLPQNMYGAGATPFINVSR